MLINKNINQSKYIFWASVLFIWIITTLIDRIWWHFYSNTPSWDQADYLNSALDHAQALSFLGGDGASDFRSFLDKSPRYSWLAQYSVCIKQILLISFPQLFKTFKSLP